MVLRVILIAFKSNCLRRLLNVLLGMSSCFVTFETLFFVFFLYFFLILIAANCVADLDGLPVDLPMTHRPTSMNWLNHLCNDLVDTMIYFL